MIYKFAIGMSCYYNPEGTTPKLRWGCGMLPETHTLTGFSKVTGARRKSPATSSVSAGYFCKSKLKK